MKFFCFFLFTKRRLPFLARGNRRDIIETGNTSWRVENRN